MAGPATRLSPKGEEWVSETRLGGRARGRYLAAVTTWGCRRWSRAKGSGPPSPGKAAATTRGSQDWCMLSIMRSASSTTCGRQEAWRLAADGS